MTQPNLVELAKQGDPQAIANLMNRTLQPKGIASTVERTGDRLKIYLIGHQPPNRDALMTFVQTGIGNLGLTGVNTVEVIGQQTGQPNPLWVQEWQLAPDEAETGFEFPARAASAPPPPRPAPPPAPPLRPPGLASSLSTPSIEDSLNQLNEAIDAAVLEGFSELSYRPLAEAPDLSAPASGAADPNLDLDDIPPEILGAAAAQQVRDELPPDLLADDAAALQAGTTETAGTAPFPSINELAAEGMLQQLDDMTPADFSGDTDLSESFTVMDEADDGLPDDDTDNGPSDDGPSDEADDEDSETLSWMRGLPNDITPSPDMEADDDLQITSLSEDDDDDLGLGLLNGLSVGAEEEPEDDSDSDLGLIDALDDSNQLAAVADEDVIDAPDDRFAVDVDETPSGQMPGSPMAIQPVSPDADLATTEDAENRFNLVGAIVVCFLAGWILALIGFSYTTREPAPAAPPSPSPQAESQAA